jgi:hypothetical protein
MEPKPRKKVSTKVDSAVPSKGKKQLEDVSILATKLEALRGLRATLSPAEIENTLQVLREWCLVRAHAELESGLPLDNEAWKALSLSGMIQDQVQKAIEHSHKIKQFSAGLDGRIEFCFSDDARVEYVEE